MEASSTPGEPLGQATPRQLPYDDPDARAAQEERLDRLVDEWEAEHGPVSEEKLQRIRDKVSKWPQ